MWPIEIMPSSLDRPQTQTEMEMETRGPNADCSGQNSLNEIWRNKPV